MHVNCLDSVVQLNNKTITQLNNKKLLSQAFFCCCHKQQSFSPTLHSPYISQIRAKPFLEAELRRTRTYSSVYGYKHSRHRSHRGPQNNCRVSRLRARGTSQAPFSTTLTLSQRLKV